MRFGKYVAVVLGLAAISHSQTLQIRTYGPLDGLPQSEITSIWQDGTGYLWFGTFESGVVRYDGAEMEVYSTSEGLAHPSARAIAEDKWGQMWIATEAGLSRISGRDSIATFTIQHGLPSNRLLVLATDDSSNLWIGSESGLARLTHSLLRSEPATDTLFERFSLPGGNSENFVYALAESEDHLVWIGTNGGLFVLDPSASGGALRLHKITDMTVRSIFVNSPNELLIGTMTGLYTIDRNDLTSPPRFLGLPDNRIFSFAKDQNGELWIGTWKYLAKYDGHSFQIYDAENGLPNPYVRSVCVDYENNVWLGTMGGGVAKIYGRAIISYNRHSGLPTNPVYSVMEDRRGRIWIGTSGGGLVILDGTEKTVINSDGPLPNDIVHGMAETANGEVWIATHGGAVQYANDTFRSFRLSDGMPSEVLSSVFADNNGEVWFGSFGSGAVLWRDGSFRNDATLLQLPHGTVQQVLRDRTGRLWIATNGGLYLEEKDTGRVLGLADGLPDSTVYCMFEDHSGAMWIGTRLGGAARYKDGRFRVFDQSGGLPSNLVYFIGEDASGRIWIGTSNGVACYQGENYQEIHVVHASGGLAADECNTRAVMRDSKNYLWLGTVGGVSRLDPAQFPLRSPQPRIAIFAVETDKARLKLPTDGDLRIKYGTPLDFQFGALSFINENGTDHRVKLEGFDDDWIELGRTRNIRYTNLAPDNYTFVVEARNVLGVTSSTATVKLSILPPFYRTPWFAALSMMLIAGLIFGLHHWRTRQMQERARQLEVAVKEKASELQDTLAFVELVKDFLPIGLLVVDANRFVVDANHAAEQLFGCAAEELTGNEFHNLLSSPILSRNDLWQRLHDNTHKRIELLGHHRDGRRFVCQVHSDYHEDKTRRAAYIILTCEDVEDRKLLETRLIESEKQLALSDLLAGVSESLNSRLSGIQDHINVMKSDMHQTGKNDPSTIIKWVQESLHDMGGLLKEMLECSVYLVKEPVIATDFRVILQSLVRRWEDQIRIQVNEIGEPIFVKLVPKFRNGLDEAIRNSIDAHATVVKIEVERLHKLSRVRLSLTDNGRGLAPESISKVFMPFFKTKSGSHSGLGLWKLYQVVKQCGGSTELVALPHGGTRLSIVLPMASHEHAIAGDNTVHRQEESEMA